MVLQLYSFRELNVADVLEMRSNLHNIYFLATRFSVNFKSFLKILAKY